MDAQISEMKGLFESYKWKALMNEDMKDVLMYCMGSIVFVLLIFVACDTVGP